MFGAKIMERSTVYLIDNTGTDIPQNLFEKIIQNFWNGSNFHIEIKYTQTQINNLDIVVPQVTLF